MSKNNKPLSVILTSYNHSNFIAEAIQSVLDQDFEDFEFIIIDDNSSDNSCDIIRKFSEKDKRINLFEHKNNLGMVSTVNEAISLSNGEFIAHMNSDDIWNDKSKLSKQVDFLSNNASHAAVFTKVQLINEWGKEVEDSGLFSVAKNQDRISWLRQFFLHSNCLSYPSVMIRKKVFDELGKYDPRYSILLDLDMWIRMCRKYEIHILEDTHIKFRMGNNSASYGKVNLGNYEFMMILKNYLDLNFDEFQNIFTPKNRDINEDNYKALLLLICLHTSRTHLKFAVERLWDILKKRDFPEFDLLYKNYHKYVRMVSENPFFDPTIKGTSNISYLLNKILNFKQYLEYKQYKRDSKIKLKEFTDFKS